MERSNPSDVMGYIIENDLIMSALSKCVDKAVAESATETRPGSVEVMYNAVVEDYHLPTNFSETEFPQLTIRSRNEPSANYIVESSLLVSDI